MLEEWAESGLVNILGGCCGTTPEHVAHVAQAVAGAKPREIPERPAAMRLAGLEPFELAWMTAPTAHPREGGDPLRRRHARRAFACNLHLYGSPLSRG